MHRENKSTEGAAQISAKNTTEETENKQSSNSQMKAETEGTVIVRKNNQERPLSAKKAKESKKEI